MNEHVVLPMLGVDRECMFGSIPNEEVARALKDRVPITSLAPSWSLIVVGKTFRYLVFVVGSDVFLFSDQRLLDVHPLIVFCQWFCPAKDFVQPVVCSAKDFVQLVVLSSQ
jgi:hypothetical protein